MDTQGADTRTTVIAQKDPQYSPTPQGQKKNWFNAEYFVEDTETFIKKKTKGSSETEMQYRNARIESGKKTLAIK